MTKRTSRSPKRTSRRIVHNPDGASLALPPEPLFIERIENVSDHLSMPGQYYTTTGQQAYLVAKTLSWHPLVQAGEETYFAEGSVFHWTVLPEEKSPAPDAPLPEELLNERVEIEYLVELSQPLEIPERNGRRLRRNDQDNGGEDWGVTENYFLDRLDAYDRWESAFWRELLQNSRDAGATRIDLSSEETTYTDPKTGQSRPAVLCVCRDNGSGMDRDTLKRAFFTLGGSVKPAGAVGGFGDAKELILVPWYRYEVRTRDLLAVGQHQKLFAPGIQAGQTYLQGTEIRVWMPVHKSTNDSYAIGVLEKSHLTGIRVYVNGERVNADLIGGDKVREQDISITNYSVSWIQNGELRSHTFAYADEFYEFRNGLYRKGIQFNEDVQQKKVGRMEIWRQPRAKRNGCFVRGSGVFMFEKQIDSKIKGAIFVDIIAPPRGVFTRKRDALAASSSASSFLSSYLEELAVDPLSALKKERAERDKQRIIYTGSGPLNAAEGEGARVAEEERAKRKAKAAEVGAEVASEVDLSKVKEKKGGEVELTPEQIAKMLEVMKGFLDREQAEADKAAEDKPSDQAPPDMTPLPETFESMAKDGRFVDREQLAGALQFAAWKPDLFVFQNLDNWKMPKDFNPLTMKPKYQRLLRLWAELCKYTLVRLGMFKPFGVGWIFDTEKDEQGDELVMGAGYTRAAGTDWLLLNPVKMKRTKSSADEYPEYEVEGDYYDLSSDSDIENLCASVIHEVTHMQGFSKHDQRYAYALTANIKIAFGMERAAKKILKGVNRVVREEVKERKAAKEAESQIPWDALVGKTILATRIGYAIGSFYSDLDEVSKGKVSVAEASRQLSQEPSKMVDPDRARRAMGDGYRVYSSSDASPRVLLRLYEALRDKGVLPSVSNEEASSYTRKVFPYGFELPDVRERGEVQVPSNIGVYNVTKRTKDGETQWVLREGYTGLRGKEVASGKLWQGDDLNDRYRYQSSLEEIRRDGYWIVWVSTAGSTSAYVGYPSEKLRSLFGLDRYSDIDVKSYDKTNWNLSSYGWGQTIKSRHAQAPGVSPLLSAAEAQAEAMRQVSEAMAAKTVQPVALPRTEVVVPTDMASDEFVRLFPLYVVARMFVPAESLKDEAQRRRIAAELGETVMIEGPEFLFSFRPEGKKFQIPLPADTMAQTLEIYGREMVREYFDKGGPELAGEDFATMVQRVVAQWNLRDTPLAVPILESMDKTSVPTD